jgi:hypothetical protein
MSRGTWVRVRILWRERCLICSSGIPFNDTNNLRLEIAEWSEPILGDKLIAFQAGNEPDLYAAFVQARLPLRPIADPIRMQAQPPRFWVRAVRLLRRVRRRHRQDRERLRHRAEEQPAHRPVCLGHMDARAGLGHGLHPRVQQQPVRARGREVPERQLLRAVRHRLVRRPAGGVPGLPLAHIRAEHRPAVPEQHEHCAGGG